MTFIKSARMPIVFFIISTLLMVIYLGIDPGTRWIRLPVLGTALMSFIISLGAIGIQLDRRGRKWMGNFLTIALSTVFIITVLEMGAALLCRSHGSAHALSHQTWMAKYWKPLNLFGFRDLEPEEKMRQNKRNSILILGDSFVAGFGVENVDDRFSNQLEKKLASQASVYNLGGNGADTRAEFYSLTRFPIQTPTHLILSYYGNDIDILASEEGKIFKGFLSYIDISPIHAWIAKHTYLVNYLYWMSPRPYMRSYIDFLREAYEDPKIMAKHQKDLDSFVNYCLEKKCDLWVVLFPFLNAIEESQFYEEPIKNFFSERSVPVIEVGPLVSHLPVDQRVVNQNDPHPSVKVHGIVAQKIAQMLQLR